MATTQWPYPGARWWKFDFHTHTPASLDTPWHMHGLPLTPRDWLLKYMAAEIDCVAVTDHNSGAWIDDLKTAYAAMQAQTDQEQAAAGFRTLTLFPGVEISVSGGFHLLAIFGPDATTRTITDLLATVGYRGTDGDSDAVTRESAERVIEAVLAAGGIPVPAHADRPGDAGKALLALREGSNGASRMDANTLCGIMNNPRLLAVEWEEKDRLPPECVSTQFAKLARVLGSDCHSFQGSSVPGSRYTWVKMASPTLEGLRLALLDGNGVSIRRSDENAFDPFRVPPHMITALEIANARYMGNNQPARLTFSPLFNAVAGGRGTGKSTVVHALRLATRRAAELQALGKENEARIQFDDFCRPANGRDDKGALRNSTVIRLQWQHEDSLLQLQWQADGNGAAVEEWRDGQWQTSASQSLNAARFPLRIFSQGQIAALAGSGRKTLLAIIDEAARVEPLQQAYAEAQRTFFTQMARLRELDGKLAGLAEIERKLDETGRRLTTLAQTGNAAVLHAYAQAQHQERIVNNLLEQLQNSARRIADLPEQIMLDDWPEQHFTEHDADVLAWRQNADQQIEQTRTLLLTEAGRLEALVTSLRNDGRYAQWQHRVHTARQAHDTLQQQLVQQGVSDPQAFGRLTRERQQLESDHNRLQQMQSDRIQLAQQIEAQKMLLLQRRQAITQARQDFMAQTLSGNPHVRIEIEPFGFDARQVERELRMLLDVQDERFSDDFLTMENDRPSGGMAFDLTRPDSTGRAAALDTLKQRLLDTATGWGGHFRNYLQRKLDRPEFGDSLLAWFPEDDLRIEYQRDRRWTSIDHGSQGQRSAALLAFLLAFGDEPIVLDQPEDDLDNHLIYDLIVQQIRENKLRRQLIVVTHNPNVVVNGDAELVHVMDFVRGQCNVRHSGALQETSVRREVCRVMEGGHEAFSRRWKRLGTEI